MNYYDILGIEPGASLDDIKRAYRKKAMKYHPDRGGDAKSFNEILQAYTELSNSYNDELINLSNPDDFFDDILNSEEQNQDLSIKVAIKLADSYQGGELTVRYELLSGTYQQADLSIPPGVKHHQIVDYPGFGDDSIRHKPRGNLKVQYNIEPNEFYIRRGDDLCTSVTINAIEAILGATRMAKTLDDYSFELTLPPGIQPGHEFKIKKKGFYNSTSERYGNFVIIVDVHVPTIFDSEILNKLRDINTLIS